ncbi:DUF4272 domain-containing protein [Marinigracilibium pacificum]|uniref:DUF4272 domain-containing protein n=1 Tax=Marinigracilibium pacificum TaxID=2729599 RepID=A0A848IT62_9BACT|nr:DUF4272 domain-containing protein [Marinigracilibium pacificum]NMM47653.1 DUF4272 domain-containing protein [Marinigracilibium pacificum]
MQNLCTIYSSQKLDDRLIELINKNFNNPKINIEEQGENKIIKFHKKNGFLKGKTNFQISSRSRNNNVSLEEDKSALAANLIGIKGFISQIPGASVEGKSGMNLLIDSFTTETAVLCDSSTSPELLNSVKQIVQEKDCMLFCQEGQFIGRGKFPHFLDKDLKLLIDVNGNSEIFESSKLTIDMDEREKVQLFPDQIERKKRNIEFVKSLGIKTIDHLPVIESEQEVNIRTSEEIASRVVMLAITNLVAFSTISGEEALNSITKYNLEKYLTPDENDFLQNPTENLKNRMSWRCEGIWVLCWALGIVDDLGSASDLVNLNDIPQDNYPIKPQTDPNTFINKDHKIRSVKEILDATDLYFRLNWACVNSRLAGSELTEVHPAVVYERQYALNWLVNYMDQDWDDVTCDT